MLMKERGPYDGLNMQSIIELLKAGADLEAADEYFNTPLINSCMNPWDNDSIVEIIKLGANINAQGRDGDTALCMAANYRNSFLCKFLIEAGADVTICNHEGENILLVAAKQGLTYICLLLIDQGKLDKNCTNTKWPGRMCYANALMYAANASHIETCKALLEAGIDINLQGDIGQTALYYAVGGSQPCEETAKLLMEAGADLNIETEWGTNVLWRAGYSGLKDLCKLIIEQGGDIPITGEHTNNHCNSAVKEAGKVFTYGGRPGISKPYTSLMIATSDGASWDDVEDYHHTDAVALIKLLVEGGSDINAVTDMGTAWSIAKDWENEAIIKLLEELGAKPQ